MIVEADAVVVGAGPAGAAFALNLAPSRRVLMIERRDAAALRIGESLPAAARRLLADMGLWQAFSDQRHEPCHAGRSVWGSDRPVEADALRDLDGPGWHLDRSRFDRLLQDAAVARGAALLAPAQAHAVGRDEAGAWRMEVTLGGRRLPIRTTLLVDAGGRASRLLRRFGAERLVRDRLVCGFVHGTDARGRQSGLTQIEAEAGGWWYTASVPEGRRVLAFHTDADLPSAQAAQTRAGLLRRAATLPFFAEILAASGFQPDEAAGFCAAHSAELTPAAGDGWIAIGDAASSFDPLSSQGLFNALYTGLAGAEAADRHLAGDPSALPGYHAGVFPIRDAYRTHLEGWYGLEQRWAAQPFWQRRHAAGRS
jgi:flavin-dependent dehydrogenase